MKEMMSANEVRSRDDLARFVLRLADDLHARPEEWENADLGSFLQALGAWLEDSPGFYANRGEALGEAPTWVHVAEMLLAARVYE